MRKFWYGALSITLALSPVSPLMATEQTTVSSETSISSEVTTISLSDEKILVDGDTASTDSSSAVYTSNDIIYYETLDTYESGNVYGEGGDADKHSAEEASKHTVVNITKPGTYRISGKLSYGQIFVNVGKDEADKVTLILDNVDINCTVAPAVFFYKVYECASDASTETATHIVDTSNAGARVIIADDSTNNISGSYVAKIYKDNTEQKKLHKYDGAFYSCMSMEIDGESKGNGILNIKAANEGLDSELHLTINGGQIHIESCDDGINVNEDGVSVFTMNDGYLSIYAGNGSEGDGIDSNGFNVINGGTVIALANPKSPDGSIDSDMGSFINGGTVIGAGNMYDPLEADSEQLFMFLELAKETDQLITVTNDDNKPIFAYDFPHNYTYIVFSTPALTEDTYHVYQGGSITGTEQDGFYSTITTYTKGTQLQYGGASTNNMGGMPPAIPDESQRPALPEDMTQGERPKLPESVDNSNHPTPPEGMENNSAPAIPDESQRPAAPPEGLPNMSEGFTNVLTATAHSNTSTSDTIVEQFTDVKNDSWYAQAVAFCINKGIMNGTSFSPNNTVTREMFATILYRISGAPIDVTPSTFTDVTNQSAYYYQAISWANQTGVTKGMSATTFGVGQAITIQDAITMLERLGKTADLSHLENISITSKSPATRSEIAALLMAYLK